MIKDRLAALKAAQLNREVDIGVSDSTTVQNSTDANGFMPEFFDQVDQIRSSIDRITELVASVKVLHNEILTAPQTDEKTKEKLETNMQEIKKKANEVRRKLKGMRTANEKDDRPSGRYIPASTRIKKLQVTMLSMRLNQIMAELSAEQVKHREEYKKMLERQLRITGRTTTSDELEQMLESGNPAIFTKGIMIEAQDARQTLAEIEARHNDIMKLESSIKELHDMFMDLAMLVESQGEMIDRIEYNVSQSVNYIDSAKADTKKAVKYRSAALKKKIIIAIILCFLFTVLIVILLVFLRK
ncbi:hypothetical protein ACOME3_005870 [Neoechinorhynchus agilis]